MILHPPPPSICLPFSERFALSLSPLRNTVYLLKLFCFCCTLFLLLSAPRLSAQTTFVTASPSIVNYPLAGPKFVIDADRPKDTPPFTDPFANHWYITAQASLTATTSSSFSFLLQGRFRLVDTLGVVVPCEGASADGFVSGLYSPFASVLPGAYTTTRLAHLVPTVTLDPGSLYRVECMMASSSRGGPTGTVATSNVFRFAHFTGPDAEDGSLNVVGFLEPGIGYSKTFAVKTDPATQDFVVTAPYSVYRYDEPNSVLGKDTVNLNFQVELYDSAAPDVPIALAATSNNVPVLVDTRANSFGFPPSVKTGVAAVRFRPASAQLNSPGKLYFAKVSLSHQEEPADLFAKLDNSRTLPAVSLLHFNGALIFGNSTANPIATTLSSVTNNPAIGALLTPTSVDTTLVIGGAGVDGSQHTFTAPAGVAVSLLANGNAIIRGASSVTLTPPSLPDRTTVSGVRYDRDAILLNSNGAKAGSITTILPAGMGWGTSSTSKTLSSRLVYANVQLTQALTPVIPAQQWTPPGGDSWVMEESKPMLIRTTMVLWTVTTGQFSLTTAPGNAAYVRAEEYALLEGSPVVSLMKLMYSNELYWREAQNDASAPVIAAGVQGGAEFTGGYTFSNPAGRTFLPHFPYAAVMVLGNGQASVTADAVSGSFTMAPGKPNIDMNWLNGCLDPSCAAPGVQPPTTLQKMTPTGGVVRLTADGGLVAACSFPNGGLDLKWGFIAGSQYAHRVVTPFTQGTFAMGGIFLKGSSNFTGSSHGGVGAMLLSGVSATTGAVTERAATAAYGLGRAEYPGINANLGANDSAASGVTGRSTLAGSNYGDYALKHRSKYYARLGGVCGIHDKVAGPAQNIVMYGYDFTLTNFGLSFLDNSVQESRVNGRIVVRDPSDIYVDFEELTFFCNGALDKGKIATSTPHQNLAYWHAPIDVKAMQFVHEDACNPATGFLTLGLVSSSSHITEPLYGTVGFHANGNLINRHFASSHGLGSLDSRFKMPKQVSFLGPKRQTTQGGFENYAFTPVADAYLNITGSAPDWKHAPPADVEVGFWNMAGLLKVSFFVAPTIHLQTTAQLPADPNWKTSVIKIANGAWDTGVANTSYFDTNAYHDDWNRGQPFPNTAVGQGSGETRTAYTSLPAYMPIAKQKWLGGAITFQYKLQWNSATRSFTTLDALAEDMVIVKIDHRLTYLSAERAEMTFGAQYAGVPKINLANFVVNQLDENTGIFKAVSKAGCDVIFEPVDKGLAALAKMLNDQTRDYFTEMLNPLVGSVGNAALPQLTNLWASGQWTAATLNNALEPVFGPGSTLRTELRTILDGTNAGLDQLDKIKGFLADTDLALSKIQFMLTPEAGTTDIKLVKALAHELIKFLSKEIGGTLGSIVGASGVDAKISELIDPLLKEVQPTLADLKDIISQLRGVITSVKTSLDGGGDFAKELKAIVTGQAAELDSMANSAKLDFINYLKKFDPPNPAKNFLGVAQSEIQTKLSQAIYDRFFGTKLLGKLQTALKHRLQDLEGSIHSGLDSVLAEVNKVVKKAVSGLLSEVDDQINGVLGKFSAYLGAGAVVGYAVFNEDALRRLRLDGNFEFKVPTAVHVEAFLEINQYTSKDQPPGCKSVANGESLTEVTIGAKNVPTDFLTPGVKLDLDAKFSFKTLNGKITPEGMGGGIAMAQGPINFEAFKITKLAVGIAFGEEENYFSAALGLQMGSYGASGGVFFGRTCTLDPIKLWDPFAAKALGKPDLSFTGIYVYGEVHIPVSEVLLGIPATCFFEISADCGAGFFVFAEGPSFGARMGLGVDGSVACILSISGRVDLLGGRINGKTSLTGRGEFCASILGIEVCKDVTISTSVGSDGGMKGKGGTKGK